MTERLYYEDAGLRTFEALVTASEPSDPGHWRVRLERTAFYPTSGGQPFDRGVLNGLPVVDVFEDGHDVVHVVGGPIVPGTTVTGEIDWGRRFDHMQQHTGQHVLSAAFAETAGVSTVSFHLGSAASSIDLARDVTRSEIDAAEHLANGIVWEDRGVRVWFADAAEAARLPLRKASTREGVLRLVEIPGCDLSACGGTHVARTGAIGIIAVEGWERFKGGCRLSFVCGGRALTSHRLLRDTVTAARGLLAVGAADIGPAIARLRDDLREGERRLSEVASQLVVHEAAGWRAAAESVGRHRAVLRADAALDGTALKTRVQAVVNGVPGLVVVAVGGGHPAPVVVARSADAGVDAGALMKALMSEFGGRGGGRPELAQGGVQADAPAVLAASRRILAHL